MATLDAVDLVIGAVVGMATGIAAWWIVTRGVAPRITISPDISKLPDDGPDGKWRYRVKVFNEKRRWFPDAAAIDLRVSGWVSVRGLRPDAPSSWYRLNFPIGHSGETAYIVRNMAFRLRIRDIPERERHLLPQDIQAQLASGEIELESLFALGSETRLRVVVTGTHKYTYGRSVAVHDFSAADIRCGPFDVRGRRVVEAPARCMPLSR